MARVLLVDDDDQVRAVLGEIILEAGYALVSVDNGRDALAFLEQEQVDLLVLDVIMPEMDGLEVLMELLKRPARPRIIAISGGSRHLDPSHLLMLSQRMRVDAVLSKPITYDRLLRTMAEVLATDAPAPDGRSDG
jgi:CheY-like chemotaxis protein